MDSLSQHGGLVPDMAGGRACDQCRQRKIRCDKTFPCYACRSTFRNCTCRDDDRPKETKRRILISSTYERKIDRIESRLASIESLLKNKPSTPNSHRQITQTPEGGSDRDTDDVTEGDSATIHAALASEALEHAIKNISVRGGSPNAANALGKLSQLVEAQKRRSANNGPSFPLKQPLPPGGIGELEMPPIADVIRFLKQAEDTAPNPFTYICSLAGIDNFSGLYRAFYFSKEIKSHTQFTVVNAMLYYLFIELQPDSISVAKQRCSSLARLCSVNLETALANMPLFLPVQPESVQALVLGAIYALDLAKPSVASHLITTAAQLCQRGGFHRMERQIGQEPEVIRLKSLLFWQTYWMDRELSLRLGQAPNISDCDITIPRTFTFDGFGNTDAATVIPTIWIRHAYIQGRVYEDLYSPSALAKRPADLERRARALAIECVELAEEAARCSDDVYKYLESIGAYEIANSLRGDEIQLQVTLTLILRVIPGSPDSDSQFCDECLDAARQALNAHQAFARLADKGCYDEYAYAHWNLLATPFAPFFVLFCYVLETLSVDDLRLLRGFVASINGARRLSDTMERIYWLFLVMCDVAGEYVGAASPQEAQYNAEVREGFEIYLTQLGFMPGKERKTATSSQSSMSTPGYQSVQISDWFEGSRNMMSLLEEDLSMDYSSST